MTFNDYKAYRCIMRPVLELKKWRKNNIINGVPTFDLMVTGALVVVSASALALGVHGICLLIVAMPHAWLAVR